MSLALKNTGTSGLFTIGNTDLVHITKIMGDKSSCTLTMILQFLSTDYDKMKDNCTKQIHFPPLLIQPMILMEKISKYNTTDRLRKGEYLNFVCYS